MNEQFDRKQDSVYSKRLKAGKRRTYFFDVRSTRGNDYFLTITESRKRMTDDGYDRHKIFLYKEDFHKFMRGLNEAMDYVKNELMPNFDFDSFNHDIEEAEAAGETPATQNPIVAAHLPNIPAEEKIPTADSIPPQAVNTAANRDNTDRAERRSFDGYQSNPLADESQSSSSANKEEVDRW